MKFHIKIHGLSQEKYDILKKSIADFFKANSIDCSEITTSCFSHRVESLTPGMKDKPFAEIQLPGHTALHWLAPFADLLKNHNLEYKVIDVLDQN